MSKPSVAPASLGDFPQTQEDLYQSVSVLKPSPGLSTDRTQAYNAFFIAGEPSRCQEIIMEIRNGFCTGTPHSSCEGSLHQQRWKIHMMARCSLLPAHFQNLKSDLDISLGTWTLEARDKSGCSLDMDDVKSLCHEMKLRIYAEKPRERLKRWENAGTGDAGYYWIMRMTAEWLEATKKWREYEL
ncbi:MAG: hypothetical protein Q9218_003745 [Villophora microphyllina]